MNSREKEVQKLSLADEKKIIGLLKDIYAQASNDCSAAIAQLNARSDMQNLQSIIYQKKYQQAIKDQLDDVLNALQDNEFESIEDYLKTSYETGYAGTMYDLQGQGIPVITPIAQAAVVKAVQTNSKISSGLYTRLGEDVGTLKQSIRTEVSRGIANGSSWVEVADKIASGMNSPYKKAMNNAIRIARTEGGRVQSEAQLDALQEASDAGADVVKQWDATLDSRTRPDHKAADGQIVELDEYFNVGGEKMKAPRIGGSARNVCNCRCCMNQRARWALDEDELKRQQSRAEYFGLDKAKDFEDFKQKYLNVTEDSGIIKSNSNGVIKLSQNLFSKSDPLYLDALSIEEEAGYEDVCLHGSPSSVQVSEGQKTVNYTANEFAKYLKESTSYSGGDIRLASCETGKGDNSFAQQLSKILGVKVKAPDSDLYYDPKEGTMFVGNMTYNSGRWRVFKNGEEIE